MVLYLMHEHPSVSQTFVVTEAAAVRRLGVPVVGYALHRGTANDSAAPIDLLRPPPSRARLLLALVRDPAAILDTVRRTVRRRLTLAEASRALLANAHAAHAVADARRAGVTHVHAHFLGRPSDVAAALARRLGCRWTATAHAADVYVPPEPGLLRERLDEVAAVACASRNVEQTVQRHAAPAAVTTRIVRCGVDISSTPFRDAGRPVATRRLVTVGRLVATKGHWTVVEAADALLRRDPELEWTIVGDGPLHEELSREIASRGLAPKLNLAGALNHADALEIVRDAVAFVLPCERDADGDSDGIPVALMEAMALGVPVVTTDVGGIPELVVDRTTGFVVPPTDAQSLVAALEHLLDPANRDEVETIRREARSKVERDFESTGQARALIDMLHPYLDRPLDAPEERRAHATSPGV